MLPTKVKIQLARFASAPFRWGRRTLRLSNQLQVQRMGIHWELDLNEGIDFSIFLLGGFERRTLALYKRVISPGSCVLDVGANIGAHTLPLAKIVGPAGKVHAFEPTQYAFEKLCKHLLLNPDLSTQIQPNQIFLTDSLNDTAPESTYASWPLTNSDRGLHPEHRGQLRACKNAGATTIDAYVAAHAIRRVDFIKIDVDGNEARVLSGARKTLLKFKPLVLFEMAPSLYQSDRGAIEAILSPLLAAGYQIKNPQINKKVNRDISSLIHSIRPGAGINLLAY